MAGTALASAQVNARLDADLKSAGDAGLAAAGLTPSQAVRALWSLAAEAEEPDELLDALYPKRAAAVESAAAEERRRRKALVEQGSSMVKSAFEGLGLSQASAGASLGELKDLAFGEKYGELMGWS